MVERNLNDRHEAEQRRKHRKEENDRGRFVIFDETCAHLIGTEARHFRIEQHQKQGHADIPAQKNAAYG
jgi:hypothetical protein